jgi:putative membrane protein
MTESGRKRKPQAFSLDDPDLQIAEEPPPPRPPPTGGGTGTSQAPRDAAPLEARLVSMETARRGFRWGAILLAALSALASIALALWFTRFVSVAFERGDWIGWTAFVLLLTAAVAMLMLVLREIVGFVRLQRLGRLRADAERAIATRDSDLERQTVKRLTSPLAHRADLSWPLARIAEHSRDVHDPGDLLRLVDRHLMMPLDGEARRLVAGAARRIGTVTAISPTALLTVGWVLVENLRLLRRLAGLYGGRPGFVGTARLARLVVTHIVATGGVAMTDDLLGQFLGQDLIRRLSRRLGESVFNAALTARVGSAAIDVIRPLPFLEAPPVRARDFIAEIARRRSEGAAKEGAGQDPGGSGGRSAGPRD